MSIWLGVLGEIVASNYRRRRPMAFQFIEALSASEDLSIVATVKSSSPQLCLLIPMKLNVLVLSGSDSATSEISRKNLPMIP